MSSNQPEDTAQPSLVHLNLKTELARQVERSAVEMAADQPGLHLREGAEQPGKRPRRGQHALHKYDPTRATADSARFPNRYRRGRDGTERGVAVRERIC